MFDEDQQRSPHNIDAEMAVLGAIILYKTVWDPVSQRLNADNFALPVHQDLYTEIARRKALGEVVDAVTLKHWCATSSTMVDYGGTDYLIELVNCAAAGPITATEYACLIRDLWQRRSLISIGYALIDRADVVERGYTADNQINTAINDISTLSNSSKKNIETQDIADIVNVEFPPLTQIVEGLIVPGLTLLCAKPKVGKSWMAVDIGLACAGGGFAFGKLKCEKVESFLLMLEDSQRRIKDRALTVLNGTGVPRGCMIQTKWKRGQNGIDDIERFLDSNLNIRLVCIDVLTKFRDGAHGNGSMYQEDYECLAGIQSVAQQRDIAIIVLHHLRKADAEDPMDLVSGTLGLTGAADHIIVVTGKKEDGYKLVMRGRDLPDIAWDMEFSRGQWSIMGDSEVKRKRLDAVGRIERSTKIRALNEQGLNNREIAMELGINEITVRRALDCQ